VHHTRLIGLGKDIWDEYADKVDAVIHTGMAGPGISTALRRGLLERG